jgi:N-acetyl-gamma-glutamyl-phosphate reductase
MPNEPPSSSHAVAVFGASGYSGAEALRLLATHPGFHVVAAGAHDAAGTPIAELYPSLAPAYPEATFAELGTAPGDLNGAEAVLLALPHGQAGQLAPSLLDAGLRLVDLSGDFRLPAEAYPEWYGFEHPAPDWLHKAVYGLPELTPHADIAAADLVANPGCYPTAAALSLAPLLGAGLVAPGPVLIDSKSGVSGAGRAPTATVHHARIEGSVHPYRVGRHQHTPELERILSQAAGGEAVPVTFVPHLVPAVRGVLTTSYAKAVPGATQDRVQDAFVEAYAGAPFVRVTQPGDLPDPKRVAGSNVCEVGAVFDPRTGTVVAVGAVDNLV